jgi:hypothetical protein
LRLQGEGLKQLFASRNAAACRQVINLLKAMAQIQEAGNPVTCLLAEIGIQTPLL